MASARFAGRDASGPHVWGRSIGNPVKSAATNLDRGSSESEIIHIVCNGATHESRVLKQAMSALGAGLSESVRILAIGHHDLPSLDQPFSSCVIERIALATRGAPKSLPWQLVKYAEWNVRLRQAVRGARVKLIHAHSLGALFPALSLGRICRAPVVYDAHELETQTVGSSATRNRLRAMWESKHIRKAQAVLSVSDSIADWYANAYGISRPHVVRNVPDTRVQSVSKSSLLREAFGIPRSEVLFLYQGALFKGRTIERLIRVFKQVSPDRHIVFMGYGELEPLIREAAQTTSNIHFHAAVSPSDVLSYTASADVGITGGENVCLSYYLSLPNKLFEFICAGLPVVAPDWPEIGRVVREHSCGWLVHGESDEAWRSAIQVLSAEEIERVTVSAEAAGRSFSWATEEETLLDVYRDLLSGRESGTNY